jgi:hypothetical protein
MNKANRVDDESGGDVDVGDNSNVMLMYCDNLSDKYFVSLSVGLLVVLTKPADAWQQSTNSSVSCSNNLYCETC